MFNNIQVNDLNWLVHAHTLYIINTSSFLKEFAMESSSLSFTFFWKKTQPKIRLRWSSNHKTDLRRYKNKLIMLAIFNNRHYYMLLSSCVYHMYMHYMNTSTSLCQISFPTYEQFLLYSHQHHVVFPDNSLKMKNIIFKIKSYN